jgi:hypothetical protein
MGMGGGGAPSPPPPRDVGAELTSIFKKFKNIELPFYRKFVKQEPLLRAGQVAALGQLAKAPFYTRPLEQMYQQYPSDIRNTLLQTFRGQIAPVLTTGGALTPAQRTAAEQQSLSLAARAGMATGPQGIAGAVLGTDVARQARFGQALGQAGQVQNLLSSDVMQRLGIAQGAQGITSEALKTAYGGELAQTGAFGGLINPLLGYQQDVANTNYNAQAAANIQAANASAAGKGGTMGMIGSVVGAAGAAY